MTSLKVKLFSVIKFMSLHSTRFLDKYFHGDFYALFRISFARCPKYVKKKLDRSLEFNLFDRPLHLNKCYVFNRTKLFTSQGTFELRVLHSFVSTNQSTMLVSRTYLVNSIITFADELHVLLLFGDHSRCLVKRKIVSLG